METLIKKIEIYLTDGKNRTLEQAIPILEEYNDMDWMFYTDYSDEKYKRNIVHICPEFEVIVIGWKPKQKTALHSHPSRGCIMKILHGTILEYRGKYTTQVSKSSCLYIDNSIGPHWVENPSDTTNAITLHIYAPPYKNDIIEHFNSG